MMVDSEERARHVEAIVRRRWLVKLSPVLACVLGLLERVEAVVGQVPEDALDAANLRRSVERHLAFSAVFPPWGGVLLVPMPWAILGGLSCADDGHWRDAMTLWVVAMALLLGFLGLWTWRVRGLIRQAARCVVVRARVSARFIQSWPTGERVVEYTCSGISCNGILPKNVPLICLAGGTVELLADPASPTAFFVRDLYAVGPPPVRIDAPDAGLQAEVPSIERYVQHGYVPKLAPIVDRIRQLLDNRDRARASAPILRAPLPLGWIPLCPATRKILAFDHGARLPVIYAAIPGLYSTMAALGGLYRLAVEHDARGLAQFFVASAIVGLSVLAASIGAAVRVRKLERLFAACVFLPGRTTSAILSLQTEPRTGRSKNMQHLTVEYVFAGTVRHTSLVFEQPVGSMVVAAPALLVHTARADQVFIRDFYV